MKSRISFFNVTAFKKNLTRFAPVWGLYTIALLMMLFLMMNSGVDYWLFANFGEAIQIMAVVNLGYAILCAQLLFGDLYNARMCNMLHALPIRREGWFITHVVSGLAFSFGPNLLMTLTALALAPFSSMVNGWQIPLWWLLGASLEFLFFFGLAVLAALCVGSRFAQAVVYGIGNFASVLAFWLVDTLYTPMLYGVRTNEEPFAWFTPVVRMVDQTYIDCDRIETFLGYTKEGYEHYRYHGEFTITGHWWYLALCAAVGLGLMALALMLYRKRRLEVAGDFIAIRALEPVFLVVYTLVVGTCFHFVISEMFGYGEGLVFLFLGLILGWFTGKMLLERRVNVFHKRAFLGCGALMGAFLLSLGIVYVDPLGIESWVPDADEVIGVGVGTGHGTYHQSEITLTEKADIEKILAIHAQALIDRIDEQSWQTIETAVAADSKFYDTVIQEVVYKEQVPIKLTYDLKDGKVRNRYYYIYAEDPAGQTLKDYFSSTEAIFGLPREAMTEEYLRELASGLYVSGWLLDDVSEYVESLPVADRLELLRAIIADCDAGTMVQHYAYHRYNYDLLWVSFKGDYSEINLSTDNVHVMQWLKDRGFDAEAALKEAYGEDYGKY